MGKRQDAALQTRKKIIEAMKELLDEKKAEEINIEEITQRAHIANTTLFSITQTYTNISTERY